MLNAIQYCFDYECTDSYTGADIPQVVTNALESYGWYALGCMIDHDGPGDYSGYSDVDPANMHYCGVDYFSVGPNQDVSVEDIIFKALSNVGCYAYSGVHESVEYDNSIINDMCRWYNVPRAQIISNLVDGGYMDDEGIDASTSITCATEDLSGISFEYDGNTVYDLIDQVNELEAEGEGNIDEWGVVQCIQGDIGLDYNFAMEAYDGEIENQSAFYVMSCNPDTGEWDTDYSQCYHYEIDFTDPNWEAAAREFAINTLNSL